MGRPAENEDSPDGPALAIIQAMLRNCPGNHRSIAQRWAPALAVLAVVGLATRPSWAQG